SDLGRPPSDIFDTFRESVHRVAGIDPGKTTGVAIIDVPMTVQKVYQTQWTNDIIPGIADADVVVVESFRDAPAKAQPLACDELPAPLVIGVIKEYCLTSEIPYIGQPSAYKRFFSDEKLKGLDLY